MTNPFPLASDPDSSTAPSFFRFRELGDRFVVTNLAGEYALLAREEFHDFVGGTLDPDSAVFETLARRNFVATSVDREDLAAKVARRKRFLGEGPSLHIVVVTGRCNETCVYCHASRARMDDAARDMSPETADAVLDLVFQTTASALTIEFQGGEPLVNFPAIQRIVERGVEAARRAGKRLDFTLVSNLAAMDEEKLAFLMQHRVQICTSIDGPRGLHNRQRVLAGGDAFATAETWIGRINEAYLDRGLDPQTYHVEALLTTTREALSKPREIIDVYRELGCKAIYLRPLDPFGFAAQTRQKIGYEVDEFLAFYADALAYLLELNAAGHHMVERFAAIFLTKILTGDDPGFLDIRSPCGAGIGQVAYNYDGGVYTCDEARMVHEMGDDVFKLGDVGSLGYDALVGHRTVRSLLTASVLDGQPSCASCAYNPYCGICPVYNYQTQGSIQGRMPESRWCRVHMGIQDLLFRYIDAGDPTVMETFQRWVTVRPRDFFVQ